MQKKYKKFDGLADAIIDFVNTWDKVLEVKRDEFIKNKKFQAGICDNCPYMQEKESITETAEVNDTNINENKTDSKEEVPAKKGKEEEISPAFDFIYSWLEVDNNGEIKPHPARIYAQNKKPRYRHTKYPISADITDYLCFYKPGGYKDESSIKSSVGRILPELCMDAKIERIGDTYRPVTIDYKRKKMIPELDDLSPIDERGCFSVSASTYIIYFTTNHLDNEIKFFERYVGKENLVDIFTHGNRIIILVKGNVGEAKVVGRALKKAVSEAYEKRLERIKASQKIVIKKKK